MSKAISTAFKTFLQQDVLTIAFCLFIERIDGKIFAFTDNQNYLTFEDQEYKNDVIFHVSTITAANLSIQDNFTLKLFPDNINLFMRDFKNRLFNKASFELFLINYEDLSQGKMVLKKGRFNGINIISNTTVEIFCVGLSEILTRSIGRTFSKLCNANFGNEDCRYPVSFKNVFSPFITYTPGDWFYDFDFTGLTTPITLTNPSFEDDGQVGYGSPITGWTRSTESSNVMRVMIDSYNSFLTPTQGTYLLAGGNIGEGHIGEENYIFQEVSLLTSLTTGQIDSGTFHLLLMIDIGQEYYNADPIKIKFVFKDINKIKIKIMDMNYTTVVPANTWKQHVESVPLWQQTRFIDVYIYFKILDGRVFNQAADNVRLYAWDKTSPSQPYKDVIYKVTRCPVIAEYTLEENFKNFAFSANSAIILNTNVTDAIIDWVIPTTNDYWQVQNTTGLINITSIAQGKYVLRGGDDGSGTQSTYNIEQKIDLENDIKLQTSLIDLEQYALYYKIVIGNDSATISTASFKFEFLNVNEAVISTYIEPNFTPAIGTYDTKTGHLEIPDLTRKIKITLITTSPSSSSISDIVFDYIHAWFIDKERINASKDAATALIGPDIIFNTTVPGYTLTDNCIIKTMPVLKDNDIVSAVTTNYSHKIFTGTNLSAASERYYYGKLYWLTGQNQGTYNIIRFWDLSTKTIYLYDKTLYDILVGDAFEVDEGCQKRFEEDCIVRFDNAINFQGFPHIPMNL